MERRGGFIVALRFVVEMSEVFPGAGLVRVLGGELVIGGDRFVRLPGLIQRQSVIFQRVG